MNPQQEKAIKLLRKTDRALAKAGLSVFVTGSLHVFDAPAIPFFFRGGQVNQFDCDVVTLVPKANWDGGDF